MTNILSLQNLTKIYPNGKIANQDISIDIEENTIHAIVGENGAGKSTLVNMIFGVHKPTSGSIFLNGKEVYFSSPNDAIATGIGMVHQHLMLAPDLTVAENMLLGMEPKRKGLFLDHKQMVSISRTISEKYRLQVDPTKKIKDIPIGVRQRVEILKSLLRNAQILILDEPTAVLTPQEVEILFSTLKELKREGKTILFISHKLNEVKEISDRITIMKDTQVVVTRDAAQLTEKEIARLMVGRDVSIERFAGLHPPGKPLLLVENLRYIDADGLSAIDGVDFELREGEILGIAGVEGNGQSQLSRILTGLLHATEGRIVLNSQELGKRTPRQIRESGVCHIPEDRMENGIAPEVGLHENLIADRYYQQPFSHGIFLSTKEVEKHAHELVKQFNISTQSIYSAIGSLSGGNIQKAVVARELTADFSVIIASQPTRGVDIGSEVMIHDLLRKMRDAGKAILLISADLDEVLKLSDRIIVFYEGTIAAHFSNVDDLTDKDLGPFMLGVERQEGAHGKISR
ncbi:MAG: ABC transporter ATP-binding protein [Sphaerochaetaceae bacterium]|jgi:simple sugar transport system ATP-binding protein|nr:ABC transporter ATP-binding protein [Sphaerochaetaceae bacterium]MDY0372396.1 ABC transporter ATP-binding protein [Sphaerochaetaceae bacterium]